MALHQHGDSIPATSGHAVGDSPGTGSSSSSPASLFTEEGTIFLKPFVIVVAGGDKGVDKQQVAEWFSALKRKHKRIVIWQASNNPAESPAHQLVSKWARKNKIAVVPFKHRDDSMLRWATKSAEAGHKVGVMIMPTTNPQTIIKAAKASSLPVWEVS